MSELSSIDIQKAISIREARAIAGITTTELANYLDITSNNLSCWEKERSAIPKGWYEKIVAAIRVLGKKGSEVPDDYRSSININTATRKLIEKIGVIDRLSVDKVVEKLVQEKMDSKYDKYLNNGATYRTIIEEQNFEDYFLTKEELEKLENEEKKQALISNINKDDWFKMFNEFCNIYDFHGFCESYVESAKK